MKRLVLIAVMATAGCNDSPYTGGASTTGTPAASSSASTPAKAPIKEPEPEIR